MQTIKGGDHICAAALHHLIQIVCWLEIILTARNWV